MNGIFGKAVAVHRQSESEIALSDDDSAVFRAKDYSLVGGSLGL